MEWRIPILIMDHQTIESGSSLDSDVLDYGEVLDNHFAQINAAVEVGTGQTSVVMWGSLDNNLFYPLSTSAGTVVAENTLDFYVLGLLVNGIPARYVYVRATQTNNEVQQLTIYQTGGRDG